MNGAPEQEPLYWVAPVAILACSLIPAIVIFLLSRDWRATRNAVTLTGAGLKILIVAVMLSGVEQGQIYGFSVDLGPAMTFGLRADALSLLFISLSAVLWFVTTVYAISYLDEDRDQRRFFGFFGLCVASTAGIALASNPLTFFFFYEMLTLTTLPLVVHRGDGASLSAGRIYLRYTIAGSAALLGGFLLLEALVGPATFLSRPDAMARLSVENPLVLQIIFLLIVGGLAVKAAMVPLHAWLPAAMVAPAPVSALLHAVAVVKAGAFGIVRVVFDVFGIDLVAALGLSLPLVIAASATILIGSVMALRQGEIKKRLAYSTVSQVSYIVLGAALLSPLALVGCLAHVVHQGLMKITLFFCAGALEKTLHIHRIDELDGVGRRVPLTMLAFTVGALGMIGIPPIAGFVTKWYLGLGGLQAGEGWVIGILGVSMLLNAAYFLPPVYRIWFRPPSAAWAGKSFDDVAQKRVWLLAPAIFTAVASVGTGLLAALPVTPLEWAHQIVDHQYTRALR